MDTLEYIDAYFQHALNENEKKVFEKRCEQDEDFAREVAFYVTSRQVLREQLLKQKQNQWKEPGSEKRIPGYDKPAKVINLKKWLPYVAAACLLIAVLFYFLNSNSSSQQLASDYVNNNLGRISVTMDGSTDKLQQGIAAYNNKQYDTALQLFESINEYPLNTDAKKYAGYTYLVQKDYDKALERFTELSEMKLYVNPGLFLKAVTLIERNREGDKEQAKQLLQEVLERNLEGSKEAGEWLKKM